MNLHTLSQALFAPQSVALIGASGDAKKNTSRPQRFLRKHGYSGRIIPVNPGRTEIFGERAYPDLQSIPDAVDHAFIMVPADAVAAALAQAVAAMSQLARLEGCTVTEAEINPLIVKPEGEGVVAVDGLIVFRDN